MSCEHEDVRMTIVYNSLKARPTQWRTSAIGASEMACDAPVGAALQPSRTSRGNRPTSAFTRMALIFSSFVRTSAASVALWAASQDFSVKLDQNMPHVGIESGQTAVAPSPARLIPDIHERPCSNLLG